MKLNKEELNNVLPELIKLLKTTSPDAPLIAKDIVMLMNQKRIEDGKFSKVFRDTTLRKLSNHIRDNVILPLVANNKGYYITEEISEIDAKIDSFNSNIAAQIKARDGLIRYKQQILLERELNADKDPFGIDWD